MIAARDLDGVAENLRARLGLAEPFADPAVGYFGLRNAVFALGDTFLEVISPIRDDAPAARMLQRRGGDCGYMVMVQLDDVAGGRSRARGEGIREVFDVSLPDMDEVHLHPADMRGAIVSLSQPTPPGSWRWGGPDWGRRTTKDLRLTGATVAVKDPESVAERWQFILGGLPEGLRFSADADERGLIEIELRASDDAQTELQIGGVRLALGR